MKIAVNHALKYADENVRRDEHEPSNADVTYFRFNNAAQLLHLIFYIECFTFIPLHLFVIWHLVSLNSTKNEH